MCINSGSWGEVIDDTYLISSSGLTPSRDIYTIAWYIQALIITLRSQKEYVSPGMAVAKKVVVVLSVPYPIKKVR